jgi:N-acetylglucosaminyldiphosphoundecaprenol N-acetyl-beta-D-mannosaminyltransferase
MYERDTGAATDAPQGVKKGGPGPDRDHGARTGVDAALVGGTMDAAGSQTLDPVTARSDVLGCGIDRLDMQQTVDRIDGVIASGGFAQHMAMNVAKLVTLRDDPRLREIVDRCSIVSPDGQGVVIASRLLGDPLPERVTGIDLMHNLLALAERRGYRVFILGARDTVLARAAKVIMQRHPKLELACRDGYFADDDVMDVCAGIRASGAHIVFVAMSSPRKEYFLGAHGERLGAQFVMGVGGAIDVMAGITRRAPQLWQRLGLEWLFRMLQEPRRMVRRYSVTNARFAWLLARGLLTERGGTTP